MRKRLNKRKAWIGLDLSLSATGMCALFEGGDRDTKLLKTDKKIFTKKGLSRHDRMVFIAKEVSDFVREYNVMGSIMVEGYSMGSKGGRAFDIAEMTMLVIMNLLTDGHEVVKVPPTTLKMFAAGKGSASKQVMLLQTFKRWGEEFSDDNLCDAYCLAQCGYTMHNKNKALLKDLKALEGKIKSFKTW